MINRNNTQVPTPANHHITFGGQMDRLLESSIPKWKLRWFRCFNSCTHRWQPRLRRMVTRCPRGWTSVWSTPEEISCMKSVPWRDLMHENQPLRRSPACQLLLPLPTSYTHLFWNPTPSTPLIPFFCSLDQPLPHCFLSTSQGRRDCKKCMFTICETHPIIILK